MRDIHPHWQEEDEQSVEVRVKSSTKEPKQHKPITPRTASISRRPAAIVGMLLVIGVGVGFFQGLDNLLGQTAPTGPTIFITDGGVVPDRLEVEHGQTITFVNNQDIEQSIHSNTLCSDTGFCLQTELLGRGESDVFSITPDMRSGPYEFMSSASSDVRGVIIIATDTVNDFVDFSSVLQDSFTPPPDTGATQENVFNDAPQQQGIARNPYTVDSQRSHPFDSQESPVEEVFAKTRGPLTQPETGANGIVVIILSSIAVLWRLTRGQFAEVHV